MQGFKWIYDTFGSGGILATMLLVRFPKIITGALAILTSGFSGIKNLFGGVRGATPANPMFVSMAGGMAGAAGAAGMAGPVPMTGMQKLLGGNVLGGKFAAGTMGSMGAGLGLGALGMLGDYGRSKMDDPNSTGGKMLGIGSKAAQYAGMGMMLGPWGALAGGILGAGVGIYDEYFSKEAKMRGYKVPKKYAKSGMGASYGGMALDGALMPDGNFIKTGKGKYYSLSPKDVAVVGQPGAGDNGGGGGTTSVNVTGTIKLEGIEDNLLNKMSPREKNELARMVIAKMNNQNR
jgi:hypothetical protein